MMMRKLRDLKKLRGPMIALVVVLSFGLVGSFTLGSLGGQKQQTVDPSMNKEQQIAMLEGLLDESNAKLEEKPNDKETLGTLAEIHWYLSELYEEEDKKTEEINLALDFYQKLLELEPNNVGVITQTAAVAYSAGQNQIAEDNYTKALELEPNNANTLASYGIYLMNSKGDFKGALVQFEKALEQKSLSEEGKKQLTELVSLAEQMIEVLEKGPDESSDNEKTSTE